MPTTSPSTATASRRTAAEPAGLSGRSLLRSVIDEGRPRLHVQSWPDPIVEMVGLDARGPYAERFWLPILGPTSIALLRRLNEELERTPRGFVLDLDDAARWLGVGVRSNTRGPIVRTIERCCSFGLTSLDEAGELLVRRHAPPLTRRQVGHLPAELQMEHARWKREGVGRQVDAMRRRCRSLALSLLQLGESPEEAERQLHRWRFHPAVAHEAMRWARAKVAERQADEGKAAESEGGPSPG